MIETALLWMNEHYPQGFFCCDLGLQSEISWVDLVSLNYPLLIHLQTSDLQEAITNLIDAGASPITECIILLDEAVSGTLGELAMKVRALNVSQLDLVVKI